VDNKIRKASWLYEDLAWKIQTPTIACKLILTFLGKTANNAGKSYASYEYMRASTMIKSDSTISTALQFLRDGLGILEWIPGGRGFINDSNRYTLKLAAMKTLVKSQGIFDSETGKLIEASPMVVGAPSPMVVDASVSVKAKSDSNPCETVSNPCESDSNARRVTLYKNNPQINQPSKGESINGTDPKLFESSGLLKQDQPTRMFSVKGVGLVEATSYQEAEQKVREQRESYLAKKGGL